MIPYNRFLKFTAIVIIFFTTQIYGFSEDIGSNTDRLKANSDVIEKRLQNLDNVAIDIKEIRPDTAYDYIIKITNQKDFNDLSFNIPQKIQLYKNILIDIKEGTYFSNSNHILIKDQIKTDCRISIKGNNMGSILARSTNLKDALTQ